MTLNKTYYALTLLVIAISGNPVMGMLGKETIYVGTFLILLLLWLNKPQKLQKLDLLVLISFLVIMLIHMGIFGTIVLAASFGYLIKIAIGLLAVRLIPNFSARFVSVMYFLSVMSLFFFIPHFVGIDMPSIFSSFNIANDHFGFHSFRLEYDGANRNSGMFWEAGAFAGYIILALFFLLRDGRPSTVFSKQGLILVITLITTQSTTGYIVFFVLALGIIYELGWFKQPAAKLVVFPVVVIISSLVVSILFSKVGFLGEKITGQFESALSKEDSSRINRFGNFIYDVGWIAEKPLLGWGANPDTRLSFDAEVLEVVAGQGNGLTGFAVKFGLIGLAIYFVSFAYCTRRISQSGFVTLLGVVVVALLLNGEQFLNFPIFLSLMFMPQRQNPNEFTRKPVFRSKYMNTTRRDV